MTRDERLKQLLEKKVKALERISRAKEALGSGSWHEDSNYELADSVVRVYEALLHDIEKEIKELEEEKLGPKV